ncbi:MAG TPA: dockerin type I repeat-containing protein [Candidatus Paceibacterota bacterium]|nr:dockerin type I repeat-containing protein [Candidatus Paceibacterota bacterium]
MRSAKRKKVLLIVGLVLFVATGAMLRRAQAAGTIIVTPSNVNGWGFVEETANGSGAFVNGPSTPPLGSGSAQLTVDGTGGEDLVTLGYAGTRLSAITSLTYSTYRVSGSGELAPSLQFDVDTVASDTAWEGRLVYEPYYTHTVLAGVWQTWNPLDNSLSSGLGNWWFDDPPGNAVCWITNPCTWAKLLAAFPNAAIRPPVDDGEVLFKAGGGWTGGFVGNVDAFSIGVNHVTTTYDFNLLLPAIKFIFANVTSSAVAGNGVTFNIETIDSSGAIDPLFEQGVTLSVGGSGAGGGLVTIINGVGTSTVSDDIAETVTLGLEDSQSTGLNVSSTANVTFLPGPVEQFTLNHPGDMNENTRLGYTLGREDRFGNLVSTGTTVAYLYSNSASPDAAFFAAAAGGTAIASTTILGGSTSTAFWYYDDSLGSRTVTASDNPSAPDGAAGIADASDTFTVAPGAVKFIFANVPSSTMAGSAVTVNVYAVDSLNDIYPSFDGGVTVTTSGSATGGGVVAIVNGVGTTTITDATAETVTLGLRDTENTGLGVVATAQIAVAPLPLAAGASLTPSLPSAGIAAGVQPDIALTFSGMAYPGASVRLISKDLGLQAAPVTQAIPVAADGSFLIALNNVTRLTGQTYLLSFVDKNGLIAQTKAYNIPAQDKLIYGNILAAPTLGFESTSVIAKNASLVVTGYATPNATVELFIDGNPAGTILVNDPSGEYSYTLSTDGLALGRHAVWAIQTHATNAVEVSGYMNSLSENELFVDDATNGTLLTENASGTYAFVPATDETENGFRPVTVGQPYTKQAESDFSNQESFTVSPLADPKLDLDGDGVIDIGDLSIFLSYLKNLDASLTNFNIVDPNIVKTLDFNGDGVVDIKDLNILEAAIASSTA